MVSVENMFIVFGKDTYPYIKQFTWSPQYEHSLMSSCYNTMESNNLLYHYLDQVLYDIIIITKLKEESEEQSPNLLIMEQTH